MEASIYCQRSAKWVFARTTSNRNANKILRALRDATNGLTKTESAARGLIATCRIDEALTDLHGLKMLITKLKRLMARPCNAGLPACAR
jgi:hypothetical protein